MCSVSSIYNRYMSRVENKQSPTLHSISSFYYQKLWSSISTTYMEHSRRTLPAAILLLFLLLVSSEVGMNGVDARTCEAPSQRFKGLCFRASNCANVCKTEGFHGGKCRGFRRRCFCTKHC